MSECGSDSIGSGQGVAAGYFWLGKKNNFPVAPDEEFF
jgi:hypothetical protein